MRLRRQYVYTKDGWRIMKINLGCSDKIMPGWINVDCRQLPGVDQVIDINAIPWPWKTNSISEILMSHVLEHLDDPIAAIREIHRVLKPGGRITVYVPHYKGSLAYHPGHKHRFSALWFYALKDSPGTQSSDDISGMFVESRSELHLRVHNFPKSCFAARVFNGIVEMVGNKSLGRQFVWESLGGIFTPVEIMWTAVNK